MADTKFTLLELHFGDGTVQVGPATLGGGSEESADGSESTESDEETGGCRCPGRTAGKLVLVLALVAFVVVVVRKLLGVGAGDVDELEDLAEFDEE